MSSSSNRPATPSDAPPAATQEGLRDIRIVQCHHCDFGSGQRGMDRCGKCDGTGAQWAYGAQRFVGTSAGHIQALDAAGYAVVPKEPTVAMERSAAGRDTRDEGIASMYSGIYRAMLAAAPRP